MVALAYSGGSGITGGSMHGNAMAMGGRRGMSDISWHPDNVRTAPNYLLRLSKDICLGYQTCYCFRR